MIKEIWVIEFRNGSLFQNPEADRGGPIETTMKFSSKEETEAYMDQHNWVYLNGAMALKVKK